MSIEIITSLISSVIGGLLVAIINQLFTKKKNEAETEKLKAEAEKIKAEAEKVRVEIKKLNSTVEQANYYAIAKDEAVRFDGTKGFYEQDYSGAGELKDGVIVTEGGYFALRNYIYNEKKLEYIPKNPLLPMRKFHVSFDAKVSQGKYSIAFGFREHATDERIAVKEVIVDEVEWNSFDLYFKVPSNKDYIIRFSFEPKIEGSAQLRNLLIAESLN
jgi:hypothetical protein